MPQLNYICPPGDQLWTYHTLPKKKEGQKKQSLEARGLRSLAKNQMPNTILIDALLC